VRQITEEEVTEMLYKEQFATCSLETGDCANSVPKKKRMTKCFFEKIVQSIHLALKSKYKSTNKLGRSGNL
jgi:hypothetical protein